MENIGLTTQLKPIKCRKTAVRTKIISFLIIIVVVSNLILGFGTYFYAKNLIFEQVQNKAMNIASDVATITDGDAIEQIKNISPEDETVIMYSKLYQRLCSSIGAEYIYIFILNSDGEPIFIAESDLEEGADDIGETFEMLDGMQRGFDGEVTADEEPTTDEWGTFISGYAPVFNSDGDVVGIVGADINYTNLVQKVNNLRTFIIIMYLTIAVILACGCYVILRLLNRGFYILNTKVEELADGSGDLNRVVEIDSGDEFETIAKSINKFIGEVRALAVVVANEAKECEGNISVINARVTDLSSSMEECSVTSQDISNRLEKTVECIQRMADFVKTIDDKVANASENAARESKSAIKHKEEASYGIRQIQDSIREAAEQAKIVEHIQVVAARIKRIASESRILSLNAQVEAARAGEAGRGFTVVASEMEALNSQINNAVDEIEGINETVLSSVNELISGTIKIDEYLTEKVLPDYDDFALLGKEYGDLAEAICEDMTVIKTQTDDIASETLKINANVHDITVTVLDGAKKVANVNKYSRKIVNNMKKLTDTSMLKMVKLGYKQK